MEDDIATRFETYRIERQLHDVPPHAVHEVVVDGRRAVRKRDTGPTGRAGVEGRVLAFVGERTDVPVPDVLAVGDDWFVADWHADAPGPDHSGDPSEAWARTAGRGLATLHAQTAPHLDGYGRLGADGDALALPTTDRWFDAALETVRQRREVLAAHGHADVADAARDALRERPGAFAGVGGPVLCHGWWSPEHVAVRDGAVACVLDFEHALAAPAEWDYWRTVLPAFDGGPAQAAFREGYEAIRALPEGIGGRREWFALLHVLYFVESLYVQNQHGSAETERRADGLRDHAFGLLDRLA
jgi:fructosamine-3-kinase